MRRIFFVVWALAVSFVVCGREYYDSALFEIYYGNPSAVYSDMKRKMEFDESGRITRYENADIVAIERDSLARATKLTLKNGLITVEYVEDSYRPMKMTLNKSGVESIVEYSYTAGLVTAMNTITDGISLPVRLSDYSFDEVGNFIRVTASYGSNKVNVVRSITYHSTGDKVPAHATPVKTASVSVEENDEVAERTDDKSSGAEAVADDAAKSKAGESAHGGDVDEDVDSVAEVISGRLQHVSLSTTGRGSSMRLSLSFGYAVSGASSARARITLVYPDGSTVRSSKLQKTGHWVDSKGRFMRTVRLGEKDGTVSGTFRDTLNAWLLNGVPLRMGLRFRIELLGPDGKVLAKANTKAVDVNL